MNLPKHSPTPWVLYNRGIGWEIHRSDIPGEKVNGNLRETFAEYDARLIVVAPEMLDVLHRVQEDICSWNCPSVWKTGQEQPHSAICFEIRALIAKATGADVQHEGVE